MVACRSRPPSTQSISNIAIGNPICVLVCSLGAESRCGAPFRHSISLV